MRQTSSQFQAASLKSRKAGQWLWEADRPVVSQTRLIERRPRQTSQAVAIKVKVVKTSERKQGAKGASIESQQGVR